MPNDTLSTELRTELKDLADAVRDLATAQEHGSAAREAQRAEGQARGEAVTAQVKAHHDASVVAVGELTRRVDALNTRVEESVKTKAGAPWWLVSTLIVAFIMEGGVLLSLYARSKGDDATAAFKDGASLVPRLPSSDNDNKPGETP
jgi:hypothetical protein